MWDRKILLNPAVARWLAVWFLLSAKCVYVCLHACVRVCVCVCSRDARIFMSYVMENYIMTCHMSRRKL